MKTWVVEHFSDNNGLQNLIQVLKDSGEKVVVVDVSKGEELKNVPAGDLLFFGSQELGEKLRIPLSGKYLGHDGFLISSISCKVPLLNQGPIISLQEFYNTKEDIFKENPQGVFLRPNSWKKDFSGQILTTTNFEKDWQRLTFYLEDWSLLIQYAPLQKILAEYRFHLIDGIVVTGSCYARAGQSVREEVLDLTPYLKFIEGFREQFPDTHGTIDLAETVSGLKLIEFNPLSTSAIYASNPQKLFNALK